MRKHQSNVRRWVEVMITSAISALIVWDQFPDGTPRARILRAAVVAALGPLLTYLRHGHREPSLMPIPDPKPRPPAGFVQMRLIAALVVGMLEALLVGAALRSFGLNAHGFAVVPLALGFGAGAWVYRKGLA